MAPPIVGVPRFATCWVTASWIGCTIPFALLKRISAGVPNTATRIATAPPRMTPATGGDRSVLVLDDEVRAANGPGQLRLLPRELERGELVGNVHPVGELEPDRPL